LPKVLELSGVSSIDLRAKKQEITELLKRKKKKRMKRDIFSGNRYDKGEGRQKKKEPGPKRIRLY